MRNLIIIVIKFHVAAGVEFSEIERCVSQNFQISFPMYSLPKRTLNTKLARMPLMRAMHMSTQTTFNISFTYPQTSFLALSSDGNCLHAHENAAS